MKELNNLAVEVGTRIVHILVCVSYCTRASGQGGQIKPVYSAMEKLKEVSVTYDFNGLAGQEITEEIYKIAGEMEDQLKKESMM